MPAPVILCIDPDKALLASLEKSLGASFDIRTAAGGKAALELARGARGAAAVVANLALPDMDGVEVLSRMEALVPDAARVALMEARDIDLLSRAVNEVGVLGVLYKPVQPKDLAGVLKRALQHHKGCVQDRQTLQETLRGSVKVLLDLMEIIDPPALGRSRRARKRSLELGRRLKAPSAWTLEMSVMLSHIGCLVLPNEITRKLDDGRDLTPEEQKMFFKHPAIAAKLLSNIKRMDTVANIILHQNSKYSKDIPLESRILKAVLDLDRQERKGLQPGEGLAVLKKRAEYYDPDVLESLDDMLDVGGGKASEVSLEDLEAGMVMAKDLKNADGTVLLLKGQHVTKASLARLKLFGEDLGITGPIAVTDARVAVADDEPGDAPEDAPKDAAEAGDAEAAAPTAAKDGGDAAAS